MSMSSSLLPVTFWVLCLIHAFAAQSIGQLEYKYAIERDLLMAKEQEMANNHIHLTEDEKVVDHYLKYVKRQEFKKTMHNFLPSMPIQDVLQTIKASEVFRILKALPKGGNMHLHQNHILDKAKMLDIIFSHDIVNSLCVNQNEGHHKWQLAFFNTPPAGWVKVTSDPVTFSKANILQHITFINILSAKAQSRLTDSEQRWIELSPQFGMAGTGLVLYENYTRLHLRALFEAALSENVQYLEARTSGYSLYQLDDAALGGHRYLDDPTVDGDSWFDLLREEIADFKRDHPNFIGIRNIIQLKRYKGKGEVERGIEKAIRLQSKYPEFISGVDLVAEEDQGHSLLYFIDEFLEAGKLNVSMPYFFHTAETNWPDDLLFSSSADDPVSSQMNVYESVILGTKRIGHGIGFVKHPYLVQMLKERSVAVEANPVSNMLLGYVTDQRHHPAINFIKSGVPVVLGADDPGTMGYNEFTVDWYEAYMGWGLGLKDLKLLAINSLNFSTMPPIEKAEAMKTWNAAWNVFITNVKSEACQANLTTPGAQVHRVFPQEVPNGVRMNIQIFGRNFQEAVCHQVICRFGTHQTDGEYVYNTMIQCPSPRGGFGTVDLSISLNGGITFIDTGKRFTFGDPDSHTQSPVVIG